MLKNILNDKKTIIIILISILILLAPSLYFYRKYQNVQNLLKTSKESDKTQTQELIEKVGRLFELPSGEEPTIASVTDKEKLKDQLFFQKAQNGDKVLIYAGAKKVILYRPSIDKIIDTAPINIGAKETATSSTVASESEVLSIKRKAVLLNGTKTVGLTKTAEAELVKKNVNIEVIDRKDAVKDYTKTFVVDLNQKYADKAKELAELINGEVSSLPSGELKPKNADFLIILGNDYVKK